MNDIPDTIEELYWRLDEYDKQQLFSYGYLMEYKTNLEKEISRYENQLQQKENIIKEVREYIEEKEKNDDNWIDYELLIEPTRIKEILDKEKE